MRLDLDGHLVGRATDAAALHLKTGTGVLERTDEEINGIFDRQKRLAERKALEESHKDEPATTTDGHQVHVVANIGGVEDAEKSMTKGAEGVGLLRSEFVFLWQDGPPAQQQPIDLVVEVRAVTPDNRRGPPAHLRIAAPPGS